MEYKLSGHLEEFYENFNKPIKKRKHVRKKRLPGESSIVLSTPTYYKQVNQISFAKIGWQPTEAANGRMPGRLLCLGLQGMYPAFDEG
jgi:hypothetical protein